MPERHNDSSSRPWWVFSNSVTVGWIGAVAYLALASIESVRLAVYGADWITVVILIVAGVALAFSLVSLLRAYRIRRERENPQR